MSHVKPLLEQMHQRFNPAVAAGMDAIFQYDISDEGSWQITVKDDQCGIIEGDDSEATVTLSMTTDTLASVISGEIDGMQAFMSGRIKATGDIILATRLPDLFPLN